MPKAPPITRPLRNWLLVTLTYVSLGLVLPANEAAMDSYHLSKAQYHILIFMLALPFVFIWLTAFYAHAKLVQYCHAIRGSRESQGFQYLAQGSRWLAWSLPVPALISLLLSSFTGADTFPVTDIIPNYVRLLLALIAFTLLRKGADALTAQAGIKMTAQSLQLTIITFTGMGIAFCLFVFHRLGVTSLTNAENQFHLAPWLIITTMIIPYLYVWFCGILAADGLMRFSSQVRGVFYRQPMSLIAGGMAGVILSSVAVQCVRTLSPQSGHLSLSVALGLVMVMYLLIGASFVLMGIGAHRLKRIEEV